MRNTAPEARRPVHALLKLRVRPHRTNGSVTDRAWDDFGHESGVVEEVGPEGELKAATTLVPSTRLGEVRLLPRSFTVIATSPIRRPPRRRNLRLLAHGGITTAGRPIVAPYAK